MSLKNTLVAAGVSALAGVVAGSYLPSAQSRPLPNLEGTWQGDYRYARPSGDYNAQVRLRFTAQEGELLRGFDSWRDRNGDSPSDEPWEESEEPFFGAIGTDFSEVLLAKEGAFFLIEVVDEDTLEARFIRTEGAVTAFTTRLERVE